MPETVMKPQQPGRSRRVSPIDRRAAMREVRRSSGLHLATFWLGWTLIGLALPLGAAALFTGVASLPVVVLAPMALGLALLGADLVFFLKRPPVVGDGPLRCARCLYPAAAEVGTPGHGDEVLLERCPECGADLTKARAVVRGEPIARERFLVGAIGAAIGCIVLLGLLVFALML